MIPGLEAAAAAIREPLGRSRALRLCITQGTAYRDRVSYVFNSTRLLTVRQSDELHIT